MQLVQLIHVTIAQHLVGSGLHQPYLKATWRQRCLFHRRQPEVCHCLPTSLSYFPANRRARDDPAPPPLAQYCTNMPWCSTRAAKLLCAKRAARSAVQSCCETGNYKTLQLFGSYGVHFLSKAISRGIFYLHSCWCEQGVCMSSAQHF